MKKISMCFVICCLYLVGTFSNTSILEAATYYVATNGNDWYPGTSTQPFRTIRKGTTVLASGDTLIIRSGVYPERIVDGIPSGLSATAPTTVKGETAGAVVLRPSGSGNVIGFNKDRSDILLEALVLDVAALTGEAAGLRTNNTGNVRRLVLRNSIIRNAMAGDCIALGSNTTGAKILNNKIQNCLGQTPNPGSHGMYIRGRGNLVEGNEVFNASGFCVQLYAKTGGVDDNTVAYNVLHHCNIAGIAVSSGTRNKVYGNLIINNKRGINVSAGGNRLLNNTIYNNGVAGIYIKLGVSGTEIKNNIVYHNGANINNLGTNTSLSNNLTEDPHFVDAAAQNFRLKATSPGINNGVPVTEITRDLDGIPRPQGGAYDIGSYEYILTDFPPVAPGKLRVYSE